MQFQSMANLLLARAIKSIVNSAYISQNKQLLQCVCIVAITPDKKGDKHVYVLSCNNIITIACDD